ncbi:MAG: peptidoglycan-binding protein [Acetatifactor sp.]|nr:peptidoglycan-binding protein [Acetatifactor sp.]
MVTELQQNLIKLGYDTNGADGIFGERTKNAVLAFQKDHGLTQDGIVGSNTQDAIKKALATLGSGSTIPSTPSGNTAAIQKMLDNIKNDTSLGLSEEKKTAMWMAAERLLNDGYEAEFVAGILANIWSERTVGKFESSAYISHPENEPPYLKYMDEHFDYRNKFSGKSIMDVGISAAIELQEAAEASGFAGKFGLGMIQWTASRTRELLESYQKYASNDKPTLEECIRAEVNFMADELQGKYAYVYEEWKAGSKTASKAGELVCLEYERPSDKETKAVQRAQNASKVYDVMMK